MAWLTRVEVDPCRVGVWLAGGTQCSCRVHIECLWRRPCPTLLAYMLAGAAWRAMPMSLVKRR